MRSGLYEVPRYLTLLYVCGGSTYGQLSWLSRPRLVHTASMCSADGDVLLANVGVDRRAGEASDAGGAGMLRGGVLAVLFAKVRYVPSSRSQGNAMFCRFGAGGAAQARLLAKRVRLGDVQWCLV